MDAIDHVFQEGRLKEASQGHEWHEGERVMKVKGPGNRVGRWNPGEVGGDLGRQGQGVGGQGTG